MLDEMKAELGVFVLNQTNHPENLPAELPPSTPPRSTLFRTIAISAFAGLIGMAYGVTALSSTLILGETASFFTILPLVATLVVIATGWVGSMIWMASNDGKTGPEV